MTKRLTREDFIQRSVIKYGEGSYDYSLVEYVNAKTKVDIICPVHGVFSQTPNSHLSMGGCKRCGTSRTVERLSGCKESFVGLANARHLRGLYSYSKVVYKNAQTDVCITCLRCNKDFLQPPNRHLNGSGCPDCCVHGYSGGKAGHLYVLQSGDLAKVGITNRSPNTRAKSVSKSSGRSFSVVADWMIYNGAEARVAERKLLKLFKAQYDRPLDKFDGCTECFIVTDVEAFKLTVKEEVFNGYSRN